MASSVSSRRRVFPPTKPGIGLSGSAAGVSSRTVGISRDRDFRLLHVVELEERSQRRPGSGLVVPDPDGRDRRPGGCTRVHRGHVHEGHRQLARRNLQGVAQGAEDRPGITRHAERREHHGIERMGAEVESGDHTEVASAAAQRPEEIGVRGLGHLDDVARSRHQLRTDELIGGQTPRPHHPSDAATERQPADTDRGRVAGADAETVVGEHLGDVPPRGTASDSNERAVYFDVVQRREVDGEPARHGSPRTVPAAAHQDRHALSCRPPHGARHVCHGCRTHDRIGLADAGVEVARSIPPVVSRCDHAPGHLREVSSSICIAQTLPEGADTVETLPAGRYSHPLRLKTTYSVTLVASIASTASGYPNVQCSSGM